MAVKYKLKEGKSLEDFPQAGYVGKHMYACLKEDGFYVATAQGIPGKCLPFIEIVNENKSSNAGTTPASTKGKKGGK